MRMYTIPRRTNDNKKYGPQLELSGVHKDGGPRRRLGPIPNRAIAIVLRQTLHAPQVLRAGEPPPVRDPRPERLTARHLRRHHPDPSSQSSHVVRVPAQSSRQLRRRLPFPSHPIEKVYPKRMEEIRHRWNPQPRHRPINSPASPRQPPPEPARSPDLQPEHILTVPNAHHRPRCRRIGEEGANPGPDRPPGHSHEGAERKRVVENGVDVAREKLDGGESPAV
ncbi:hypothetical protein DsansV1_C24g0182741 [Dioscorea sansibarensis]